MTDMVIKVPIVVLMKNGRIFTDTFNAFQRNNFMIRRDFFIFANMACLRRDLNRVGVKLFVIGPNDDPIEDVRFLADSLKRNNPGMKVALFSPDPMPEYQGSIDETFVASMGRLGYKTSDLIRLIDRHVAR